MRLSRVHLATPCFALLCVITCRADAAELKFKSRIVSRGSIVLLGDVADVQGANPIEVESLKRVELFPAPSQGASRTLRRREVRELLSLRGVDLGRHQVAGSHTVHVAPRLRQPKNTPELKQPPKPEAPRVWFVTATRPLSRGDRLRKRDVTQQQQTPKQRITDAIVQEIDGVIGMELTQPLNPGQPLKLNMLRHPILVHRNELITVISRAPGVQAQLTAKATQQGSMGELVIVQSLETREKFPARVSGHKQAEVYAGGIVVPSRPRPTVEHDAERISLRVKP